MNILYITRGKQTTFLFKKFFHFLRDCLMYRDQDGFFEASLASVTDVTVTTLGQAEKQILKGGYDAVVMNWKQQGCSSEAERSEKFVRLLKSCSDVKKAVFVGAAKAEYLPSEEVIDHCDVIFKREPFLDRSRYNISPYNQKKIFPTMIHCPFVRTPRDNWLSKSYHLIRPSVSVCEINDTVYEVGFSGTDAASHSLRREVWARVLEEGFSTIGGLQPNPKTPQKLPVELEGPRIKRKDYRDALCRAKVNLALDGIGEYTFRHQEILYLGGFLMSGPSIRDVELPMPLVEGVHYVAFDDLDDMVEKIRYYLDHEDERLKIAAAGKELFSEYYDPISHGQQLLRILGEPT